MIIAAPQIASARKAGQFVIVQLDSVYAERIPLTIADADPDAGTVTIVFQTVGKTTHTLATKRAGDSLEHVLGPLGNPTNIQRVGTVVCVGGGIGAAPLFPIVQAHKAAGNTVIVIIGARNADLIIFEDRLRRFADELVVVTDDGSAGMQGLVTAPLKNLCESAHKPHEIIAIGPPIMMKYCARVAAEHAIPVTVSLNTLMVDGTGMCGCCRVQVHGKTRFVCVDGPEFDGAAVDFDSMIRRLDSYTEQEKESLCAWKAKLP
ncbi:ferredoxin/flavodoxin---NADP+ reductase [Pillotina sp. SPG140]|jgi:ferredoxin--NADP+ reductase